MSRRLRANHVQPPLEQFWLPVHSRDVQGEDEPDVGVPVGNFEFLHCLEHAGFDGIGRDPQPGRDLWVGVAACVELEDIPLPVAEPGRLGWHRHRGGTLFPRPARSGQVRYLRNAEFLVTQRLTQRLQVLVVGIAWHAEGSEHPPGVTSPGYLAQQRHEIAGRPQAAILHRVEQRLGELCLDRGRVIDRLADRVRQGHRANVHAEHPPGTARPGHHPVPPVLSGGADDHRDLPHKGGDLPRVACCRQAKNARVKRKPGHSQVRDTGRPTGHAQSAVSGEKYFHSFSRSTMSINDHNVDWFSCHRAFFIGGHLISAQQGLPSLVLYFTVYRLVSRRPGVRRGTPGIWLTLVYSWRQVVIILELRPLQPGDPERVGGYPLLGCLGAGGFGRVFLGVSRDGRQVAVKVIRPEYATDAEFRSRFRREVRAARRVSGLYTAAVVDADPDATPPWMVTAYIPGPSLAEQVASHGPFPPSEVARLGAALAEGLAAIHRCDLIHRDLNPRNIMLAADRPRIIDFGIARVTDASTLTRTGTVLGTLAYMSPEQIEARPIHRESDVFSLGGVLVYAATGHGPFDAENPGALWRNIVSQSPSMPGIDGPLRELIEDCLRKEPAQRPAVSILLARLTAMATTATPQPAPTPSHRVPPQPGPRSPGASGALVMRLPEDETGPLSQVAFSPDGATLAGSAAGSGTWRVYLWDTATGQNVIEPFEGRALDGDGDIAPLLAFSPDGRLLAITGTESAHLRRAGSWQLASPPVGSAPDWQAIRFSPNGYLLVTITMGASGFAGTEIRLWSTATLRPVHRTFRLDSLIAGSAVRFSPDGRFLLAGTSSDMFLCDMSAQSLSFEQITDHNGLPGMAAFSADGLLIAAPDIGLGYVSVLDAVSRRAVTRLNFDQPLSQLDFSPAGQFLATATSAADQHAIDVWAATGHPVSRRRLEGLGASASALRFSPDGRFLAATGTIGQDVQLVRVWRTDSTWPGASITVAAPATVTFSPDSRYFAVSAADQTARLWDTRAQGSPIVLGEPASPVLSPGPRQALAFSPDSALLATTDRNGTRLWRLP